jgi:hypothetical protein
MGEAVGRQSGHRLALEGHLARRGAHDAGDGLQRGALAHAVAAQETHHFPRLHLEGDAVQDMALAVVGLDVLEAQQHQLFR